MKKLFISHLLVIAIGLLALFQFGRLRDLNFELGQLRKEIELVRLRAVPAPLVRNLARRPLRLTNRLEELKRQEARGPGGIPLLHPELLFKDYPEIEASFFKATKGQLRLENAEFFELAGLSEEEIDRFLEISISGERAWAESVKEAQDRGSTIQEPSITARDRQLADQRKREMEQLLGPERLEIWKEYHGQGEIRAALKSLAKATVFSSEPISATQLNDLVALCAKTRIFEDDVDVEAFSNVSRQASQILSPTQQQVFDLMIRSRMAAMLRAMNRSEPR